MGGDHQIRITGIGLKEAETSANAGCTFCDSLYEFFPCQMREAFEILLNFLSCESLVSGNVNTLLQHGPDFRLPSFP